MRPPRPSPTLVHTLVCVGLLVLTGSLYLRTLDCPMQYDDLVFIQDNPLITRPWSTDRYTHAREFVQHSRDSGIAQELITGALLRPLAYATFRLNWLFDGFHPRWYRAANITIHAFNALLVYALLTTLLRDDKRRRHIAIGTAVLFAAHPLATESVTFITQRFTSLAALFYLGALVLHLRGQRALAVVSVVLGMFTKSCVFTAPVLAVVLDHLVQGKPLRLALHRAWPLLATMAIVPALVLFTTWASGSALTAAVELSNGQQAPVDPLAYALTQPTVLFEYLRKIIWPTGLSLDPEWPLYRSLTAWPVLLASLGIALITGLAVWLHRCKDMSAALAGVLWFIGTLIVSSSVIPLPDWIADHRPYLASISVLALLTLVLRHPLAISAVAIVFSSLTLQRNLEWRSTITLWEATAATSPHKARVWCNLGTAYGEHQHLEDALNCYQKAIALEPRYETAHVNSAFILNDLARFREAADQCQRLITIAPTAATHVEVVHCQAVAQIGLGQLHEGLTQLQHIAQAVPGYRPTLVMLGQIYSRLHQPQEALRYWRAAQQLQPDPALNRRILDAEHTLARSHIATGAKVSPR